MNQSIATTFTLRIEKLLSGNALWVFGVLWATVFVLYLPAAEAGRVGDFPGWVNFLNSVSFLDYINRKGSGIPSMYQLTQMITWVFYQFFGSNAWLWHLLYITLQALNACLLFLFFRRLFTNSGISGAPLISFIGAFLFCVCPHISEVVVWEPSFHYLLGLLFIVLILLNTQSYLETGNNRFALLAGIIFFLSTYSLEVFYLTPLFVLTLGLYYRGVLYADSSRIKGIIFRFLIPQVLLFLIHLALLHLIYHQTVAHIGAISLDQNVANFSKPLKYIYHLVFLGRYFPAPLRASVYDFCESRTGLVIMYLGLVAVVFGLGIWFKKMQNVAKATVLLFVWTTLCVGLIMPLWFPPTGFVIYDRYTYMADGFVYFFLVLWLWQLRSSIIFYPIIVIYILLNARFTHKVNSYWKQSAHIVNNLVKTFPNDPTKKVLLLSLPECLDGVQMVGTRDDGEFRMMYNATMPTKLTNPVYDVEAFYMQSPNDGAHVTVTNDSTLVITLNQWSTWWLYYGLGSTSYDNADFKVNMKDEGHLYEVTLHHQATEYLLLYSIGDQWHKVDWNKKGEAQY